MIVLTLQFCFAVLTISVLFGLYRMAKGPTVLDRILSFDIITSCIVGMIVLLSIRWRTSVFLELILIFSLLGFFGTVSFVYYLHRTQDVLPTNDEDDKEEE
ncbi:MAG: sodium:proton antiporter [Verrucomicrobia bacterium]|nr:sodium:proton antiporter [Verrucomicrobiota bacterium]